MSELFEDDVVKKTEPIIEEKPLETIEEEEVKPKKVKKPRKPLSV